VWLSLPDVYVTLQPAHRAVALLALALLYLLMAGVLAVMALAVLAAITALALDQRVYVAEMEMLDVLDVRHLAAVHPTVQV
jgi:hypothetical protein